MYLAVHQRTYHSAGLRRGTATFKFYDRRDNLAGHELFAAALVAQVPQPVVTAYLTVALAAHDATTTDPGKVDSEGNLVPGGLSRELYQLAQEAATLMAATIWRPRRSWFQMRRNVLRIYARFSKLEPEAGRDETPASRTAHFNPWNTSVYIDSPKYA
ncbi:MAG: hypothetical protein GEV07_28250 [Streptosporangiales bacterium]|nr:hypothetical protein [Streptosporangiales bacterium]